jgi:hypothetical protein
MRPYTLLILAFLLILRSELPRFLPLLLQARTRLEA